MASFSFIRLRGKIEVCGKQVVEGIRGAELESQERGGLQSLVYCFLIAVA